MFGFEEGLAFAAGDLPFEVDAAGEGQIVVEKRFVGGDGAFGEAVPAAAKSGFFLEEEVSLLVDPEGGVRSGHSCLAGDVIGGGRVEKGFEDPAFSTEEGGFAL